MTNPKLEVVNVQKLSGTKITIDSLVLNVDHDLTVRICIKLVSKESCLKNRLTFLIFII